MDFKVLIAESSIADLKEIVARDDANAATRLGNKLIAHALSLQTMPQRFPFHDQQRGIRKMPLPPFFDFLHLRRSGERGQYHSLLARRATLARVLNGATGVRALSKEKADLHEAIGF